MRLTRTHLSLIAALALVLGGGTAGFLLGTGSQPAQAANAASAAGQIDAQDFDAAMAAAGFALDPTAADTSGGAAAANAAGPVARLRAILGRRLAAARLLVHAQATFDLPQRGVQTFALDHGTIGRVDATGLTVTEMGGATVNVTIDAATKVRAGGAASTVASLTPGLDVIVISEQAGGGWTGLAIVVLPPKAAAPASSASPAPSS